MIHLQKTQCPEGTYRKLHPKKFDPFRVLKKCGDNAYKIELLEDLHEPNLQHCRHNRVLPTRLVLHFNINSRVSLISFGWREFDVLCFLFYF